MSEMRPLVAVEEALREGYAALNRNDVAGFVRLFDSDVEWIEPSDLPDGGRYRGKGAVEAHLSKARENWAEGSCEPGRFILAGDKVVAFDDVRVRLKHETAWRVGETAVVYTFREGKVIQGRVFWDRGEALAWAGVRGEYAK